MDKKYTAREVAEAILAKAKEVYDSHNLAKADYTRDSGIKGVHPTQPSEQSKGVSFAGRMARHGFSAAKQMHQKKLDEIKNMPKPNLTKNDATIAQSDQTPDQGVQSQPAPEANPAEQKENNNPPWGTEPGHYKLARFMGHRDARKKTKVPQNG